MSRKNRRKRAASRRESGVIKTKEADPDDIRKAIYHIDAYRSHIYYNLSFVDDMVEKGTLGEGFGQNWKNLRRKLIKMAKAATSNPDTIRLARYQSYTEGIWQVAVPIVFVVLIIGLIAPQTPIIGAIAPYIMITAFAAMIIGLLGRYILGLQISRRIDKYFIDNPEAQQLRSDELKMVIQGLINLLREILYYEDEEPKDHLVGLGIVDYDYVEIVKTPKPWRQYYLVQLVY
ncbi:MAG: hypothetical protein AM325_011455 [Candidatus Thorarchaeota archaeon SMTZ1-45]|nr:MAG: hypothetical protein AM325_13145 [Candidatus Thorarchaeota archaeon SMTZ1-45]